MDWRAESAAWIEQIQGAASSPLLALGALCASVILLFVLAVRNRHLKLQLAVQGDSGKRAPGTGDVPSADPQVEATRTLIDRVLPRHSLAFYLLALAIAAACWGMGLALAPSVTSFLESREWHIQPFYLAAHLIALRLFVRLFVRNYVAGASHLDIPADRVTNGIRRVLGLPGGLVAIAIALPFCILDYRYLVSDRLRKAQRGSAAARHRLRDVGHLVHGVAAQRLHLGRPGSLPGDELSGAAHLPLPSTHCHCGAGETVSAVPADELPGSKHRSGICLRHGVLHLVRGRRGIGLSGPRRDRGSAGDRLHPGVAAAQRQGKAHGQRGDRGSAAQSSCAGGRREGSRREYR